MTATLLDERYLRLHPLPEHSEGDKHSRGQVLVIAGHLELPGAALLAGLGALRAGAGVLRIATCRTNAPHLGTAMPEAMVIGCLENDAGEIAIENAPRLVELARTSDAVLIGPGMLDRSSVGQLCSLLLNEAEGPKFVLDASAFTSLRDTDLPSKQHGKIVCTPHFGEMAKFLERDKGDIEKYALETAFEAACRLRAVITLKGSRTYIASFQGDSVVNERGKIGLATSGSGDTLAGIIAGLIARGAAPLVAAAWGVYLHATAGRNLAERIGPLGLPARELPNEVPAIMRDLSG